MNSINPIGSTTSMAAYKVADDSQKPDATKKAGRHGGGHHRAEAPAPAPDVDPATGTSTSSILDVTA
ncbi:hypothetical protein [Actinoplanes sp. NPDC051411]|uniref:hypothetical protein n=1 Tax=Actinoplanes sp. NPDC051411 TaxID=3155522 RepID=UPI0034314A23